MGEEGVDGVDRITAGRLAKLGRLEEAGVRAFPTTFSRSHRAQEIHADFDALNGQRVCVAGRLDVFRKLSSNLVFVEVKDEAGRIPQRGRAGQFATEPYAMDTRLYLRIALELYLKRCIIGGIERVYEIGRNFRNESVSFKHSPEFTMLELYQAYADYQDIMRLTEDLVATAARAAIGRTRVRWNDVELDFNPPWQRMPLRTAIAEFSGVDYAEYPDVGSLREAAERAGLHTEPEWNRGKIMDELLTAFVEPKLIQPTFLTDYPTDFPGSTLAKGKPEDPDEVERFEAFAGGIEIANAFSEPNDPRVQRVGLVPQVR